jgi:GNAT superfamily N-acetyltransferase
MRLNNYLKEENIKFTEELTAAYSGQKNFRLSARINGEEIGYLEYSLFRDEVYINYIYVDKRFRSKSIGKKLVLFLQSQYPKTEIDWGMLTGQGVKLQSSLKGKLYIDKERIKKTKSLQREKQELEAEEKALVKKLETQTLSRQQIEKIGDRLDRIADRQYEIEKELH